MLPWKTDYILTHLSSSPIVKLSKPVLSSPTQNNLKQTNPKVDLDYFTVSHFYPTVKKKTLLATPDGMCDSSSQPGPEPAPLHWKAVLTPDCQWSPFILLLKKKRRKEVPEITSPWHTIRMCLWNFPSHIHKGENGQNYESCVLV